MNNQCRLVSIVIPCFDKYKYIESCVESIVNSTYKNFEILLSNDGDNSFDTISVMEKIKNKYPDVVILNYEKNKGISYCRNFMISHANGKYILPLDGDDFIHQNFIEEAVRALDSNSDVGLVYSLTINYYQKGSKFKPWVDLLYNESENIGAIHYIPSCNMFRKSAWESVGGYDESLRSGWEDLDFNLKRVMLNQKFVRIDKFYFFYRMLEKSRSTQFHQDQKDVLKHKITFLYKYMSLYLEHADIYNYLNSKKIKLRKRISKIKIKLLFLMNYYTIRSMCNKYK